MNPPEPLQKLHNLDKTSPQFYQEISEFIHGKDYRDAIPTLQGEGLVWLVEYLDGVSLQIIFPRVAPNIGAGYRRDLRYCRSRLPVPARTTQKDLWDQGSATELL